MPFVAAIALLDGRLESDQFQAERYADPSVLALMDRVECVADPALDAALPGQLAGLGAADHGRRAAVPRRDRASPGDPDNPLSQAELTAKFDSLTRHCYDPGRRAALRGAVQSLPDDDGLETIMRLG